LTEARTATPHALFRRDFVRRIDALGYLEDFLVAAVATILCIRAFLAALDYPQLSGGGLHIAHMLWGGLGMMLAIVAVLSFQGRFWLGFAAVIGGIGFGAFVDELGKFITADNNYFFQPAVALIYLIFVGLYLLFRALGRAVEPSPQVALVNAFDFMKEAVLRDLDDDERQAALGLLGLCDPHDPVVSSLSGLLHDAQTVESPTPRRLVRLVRWSRSYYGAAVETRWFRTLFIGYYLVMAVVSLVWAVANIGALESLERARSLSGVSESAFASLGSLLSALAAGALVVFGILRWRDSRLSAYLWFERAVLVSIFFGQFFNFYEEALTAVFGLAVLLVTLATLRYAIGQERRAAARLTA